MGTERDREQPGARRAELREEVTETRVRPAGGVRAAHDRFGGIDVPASLVGMLTALALLVLLGGLVGAAVGAIGYQTGLDRDDVEDISLASLIGGLVVLFLSYLVGGWTAGRIARYDGPRNGLMTAIWTLLLAAVLSALAAWLGDEYDVLRNRELPQWFSTDALTTAAIVSGVVAVATMIVAAVLGGAWGERYHRRADATIASTHEGGVARRTRVEAR